MSRILFVNGNLHGHINPTLPIVRELVRRGEDVYYYSTLEFQSKIEACGAIFLDYGEPLKQFVHSFHPHGNHPFYTLMEYMLALDRTVLQIVESRTKHLHFDYLLHDIMFGAGNIIARKKKLPAISSCSSFLMESPPLPERMLAPGFHPQLDSLLGQLKDAAEEWGIAPLTIRDVFCKKEERNLIYTSRLFQPQGDSFDNSYRFVGPCIAERNELLDFSLAKHREEKLLYISLGSMMNDNADFYYKCIEAFRDKSLQVILSVGTKIDITQFTDVPNNFILRSYVPQLTVLQQADLMISHGGLNSVSEALYYKVPVIAIPLANDQPAVAKRITELGAGLMIRLEELTPELLYQSVVTILSNTSYQENCKTINQSFQEAGGYKKAADEILSYISGFGNNP